MYVIMVEVIQANNWDMTGMVASMRVPHYGNTRFGTNDLLYMLLQRHAIFAIVPKSGPTPLC